MTTQSARMGEKRGQAEDHSLDKKTGTPFTTKMRPLAVVFCAAKGTKNQRDGPQDQNQNDRANDKARHHRDGHIGGCL